ncbi:hypothetical protein OSG_eHP5_00020 [environmental Halophage eHP-5]|jgi:hypothetical protein|nr:hypothetical protein OSG_eHP5_00020 [environmental Halophage eHP-5]
MAAEELVVKALPEGFGETNDKLETTDEKFEEVSGSMEESTGLLSSLANKFGGALSAIVAGVAVATAGILSQVPILGEVVSGLTSVINAVAFQLDKRLRPVLGPVRDGLFELAQAIFEGNFGKAESIIKDFVDAIVNIDFGAVFASITDAVDGILLKIRSAFDGRTAGGIVDQILGLLGGFVSFAANRLAGFIQDVIKALSGTETDNVLAEFLVDSLGALVDFTASATNRILAFLRGLNYGSIINTIIAGLINVSEKLTNGIVDLVKSINWNKVAKTFREEFIDAILGGYDEALSRTREERKDDMFRSATESAMSPTDDPVNTVFGNTSNTGRTNRGGDTFIDGRSVNKQTGRYRFNPIANRGGANSF